MNGLDFINGNINKLIFKISIPLILASSVTIITQMSNIFFLGHDEQALYVLSLYIPISFFLTSLIEALQTSNQVVISYQKGSGNNKIHTYISNGFLIGLLVSIGMGLLIFTTAPLIADYYHVKDEDRILFLDYVKWMMVTNIIVILNVIVNSSLRGLGKVNIASILNILFSLSNIALIFFFVYFLKWGLYSIIFSNLISSVVFLLLGFIILIRLSVIPFKKLNFRMESFYLRKLKTVGIPIFLSYLFIFISTLFFNKIVSQFGPQAVAGYGVAYRIQTMVILPAISLGSALGIILNHNLGAGKNEQIYFIFVRGLLNTLGIYTVISTLVYLFRQQITSSMIEDTLIQKYTSGYLEIVSLSYVLFGVILTTIIALEQINKGVVSLTIHVLYFFISITVSWILTVLFREISYFYWTISITNVIGGIVGIVFILSLMRKEYKKSGKEDKQIAG